MSEMLSCAGRSLSSPPGLTADAAPQVTDEEAISESFIPADSVSAVLISPRRVLVTGGVLADERVLPLTVLRFLDLDLSPRAEHAWTKPLALRSRGKRKRPDSAFPVCRMEQTLTYVPESASLFLIGGLKVGGKDEAMACKTMFAFDVRAKVWECVQVQTHRADKDSTLGPRFAHFAVYVPHIGGESRSSKARKSSGYILVHGGYTSTEDDAPCYSVHVFDVRSGRWSLRSVGTEADPPRRAYHAGVATASFRYFVAHGGQCSHLGDSGFLSSDLIIFDIIRSCWIRPNLLPASCTPPTARKRHCMVNGIGKHTGAILLFGGELCSGSYSNELFVLRVIESETTDRYLNVVWEKVDIHTPERGMSEVEPSRERESSKKLKRRTSDKKYGATAGGILLAIPALKKYLVVGGRGVYGVRQSPLLLDASEVEKLDRFDNGLPDEQDHTGIHGAPRSQGLQPLSMPARKQTRQGTTRAAPPLPGGNERENKANTFEGDVTKGSGHDKKLRKRNVCGTGMPSMSPNTDAKSVSEDGNLPILPKLKAAANGAVQNNGSGSDGLPRCEEGILNQQGIGNPDYQHRVSLVCLRKRKYVTRSFASPATRDGHAVPTLNASAAVLSESGDIVQNVVENEESKINSVRGEEPADLNQKLELLATKRRRLANDGMEDDLSRRADDMRSFSSSGIAPVSEFVTASDLALQGRQRNRRPARGRVRRQGTKSKIQSVRNFNDESEEGRTNRADEGLVRERARRSRDLQAENTELKLERDAFRKDNLDMNNQMKSLLSELEGLRASRGEHRTLGNVSSRLERSATHEPSRGSGDVQQDRNFDDRTGIISESQSEELQMLQSKTADLLEEYEDIVAEKAGLSKSLKEAEEGRRTLQSELHSSKNKQDQLETERDQLRKQVRELRVLVTELRVFQDSGNVDLLKSEEKNSYLQRDRERLKEELREINNKLTEEKLEFSNTQRLVSSIKCQLTEAQKKYDEFDSTERRLKGELGCQLGKLEELQVLLDQAKLEKQKTQEENINLSTELASLRTEYERSQNGYQLTLRDLEKSRFGFHQGQKEIVHLEGEMVKYKRDLSRVQRERDFLRSTVKKRECALLALRPVLTQVTNEIEALLSVGKDFDYSPVEAARDIAESRCGTQEREGQEEVVAIQPFSFKDHSHDAARNIEAARRGGDVNELPAKSHAENH